MTFLQLLSANELTPTHLDRGPSWQDVANSFKGFGQGVSNTWNSIFNWFERHSNTQKFTFGAP